MHLLLSDLTATGLSSVTLDADVTDCPGTTLLFLGFNMARAPLSDSAVRASINSCMDRSQIVTALLAGHAVSSTFPISPLAAICPEQIAPTAISIYESALQNAGCSAEKPHSLKILVNEENSFKVSIANYLCQQFSCNLLTLSVEALPWNSYLSALQSGAFDLYLGELKLTADWNVSPLLESGGSLNYGHYASERTDALLASFLASESSASAKALCSQLSADSPIAPIAFKSISAMTSVGLISKISPTASNPFQNFAEWEFHFN